VDIQPIYLNATKRNYKVLILSCCLSFGLLLSLSLRGMPQAAELAEQHKKSATSGRRRVKAPLNTL